MVVYITEKQMFKYARHKKGSTRSINVTFSVTASSAGQKPSQTVLGPADNIYRAHQLDIY